MMRSSSRWNDCRLALWLAGSIVLHLCLHKFFYSRPQPEETSTSKDVSTTSPYKLYGHLHEIKTAGSNINGLLAAHYERVCGNKGYSYDAYQHNVRAISYSNAHSNSLKGFTDRLTGVAKSYDRGNPGFGLFYEIGVEDCDYVSYEGPWWFWTNTLKQLEEETKQNWTLELHVPCRDGLDQLMSQANHLRRVFECPEDISNRTRVEEAVDHVYFPDNRVDDKLLSPENHIDLKCFQPVPPQPYIAYMGQHLQTRKIQTPYLHRSTNSARNKSYECIWAKPDLQNVVRDVLVNNYPWNSFCQKCMGSENELVLA